MPKQVTYGVSGLIDWSAMIPIGKARLRVHFTGGALTKYGVTPAEYTTTDPLTQRIIEDSAYYRSGKIVTLRSVGRHDAAAVTHKCDVATQRAYEAATLPFDQPPAPDKAEIEVSCIEDAIEYMRERHNIPAVRIRTAETLQSVAAQYGITFKIAQP